MNDDSWMRELGRVAEEEERADHTRFAAWERLSAGDLSSEEAAALAKQAETSEEARQTYEAFRPLGPEFEARILRALQPEGLPAPAAATPTASILAFPRHAKRIAGWLAAAGTVAASLALLLLGRSPVPPMPVYALEISGGIRTTRGAGEHPDPASWERGRSRPPPVDRSLRTERCEVLLPGAREDLAIVAALWRAVGPVLQVHRPPGQRHRTWRVEIVGRDRPARKSPRRSDPALSPPACGAAGSSLAGRGEESDDPVR